MAKKAPVIELPELAKARLKRLDEVSPEDLAREVEEARRKGYKFIAAAGPRIMIRDYSLKPQD